MQPSWKDQVYMYNSILEKRIAIERFLNRGTYRAAPLGSLCSHTLNRMVIRNSRMPALRIVQDWFWVMSRVFTSAKKWSARCLLLLPNLTERGKAQLKPVHQLMQPGETALILISELYRGASPLSYGRWFLKAVSALPGYIRLLKACNREFSCFRYTDRVLLLQVILLQSLRYEIAHQRLKQLRPQQLVVDLDRGYFQAPLVLAGNHLGVETITMVHGIIFPPYLYVPVIARTVFCWGRFHEQFFRPYNDPSVQYVITGNPAFRDASDTPEKSGSAAVTSRLQHPRQRVVTCVSQNFSDQAQYAMISSFCRCVAELGDDWLGVVKAHPADKTEQLHALLRDYPGVVLLDKSVSLEEVMQVTDLFMVVNSNVAFDAVLAGKPVFFWHIDEERSGLAGIFSAEAGAVMVKNETELTGLLRRCSDKGIDREIHAGSLASFAGAFCAHTGVAAARLTRQYLISD